MTDRFAGYAGSLDDPASLCRNIEPSDSVPLPEVTRAIYIGAAGSLRLVDASGNTSLFEGLVGGTILPVRIQQVLSTRTTATGLVAML
jgi:hypothetical protein